MYDLLIKNATVIDGTGSVRYQANILVNKGRILKISNQLDRASIELSAEDCLVTPGFIDVSSHSDTYWTLFSMPSQKSLVTQGITTIVGGNCGSSLAPIFGKTALESIQKWANIQGVNVNWQTLSQFWQTLQQYPLGVNVSTLIGYSTVRRGILGDQHRALMQSEKQVLHKLINQALEQGALGVSLGLAFSHMQMVDQAELIALAQLLKKQNKILSVHIRNEGEAILSAVQEVIDIVAKTGVKTHLNHLKILGHKNWKYYQDLIALLDEIKAQNLPISFDIFPYTANNMVAYLLLPAWVASGGKKVLLKNLQDKQIRSKIIQDMKLNSYDYQRVIVSDTPMNKSILGKNILEIAKNQGLGIEEALIQLILASEGQVRIIVEAISPEHLAALIQREESIIGTDGAGYDDSFIRSRGYEHPRSFGAMVKFLEDYALSNRISWEQAIAKLTSLPARIFALEDRGVIAENMQADLVIFNPTKLHSSANFSQPTQYAQGIESLILNGRLEWHQGEFKQLSGMIIQ